MTQDLQKMTQASDVLLETLQKMGISTQTWPHEPVFTVEEAKHLRGTIPGGHSKNLFLQDRQGQLFLIVALEDARIDLKQAHLRIGAQGRLSFGPVERLEQVWGVKPGSVTPFGAINDVEKLVKVILDAPMMEHASLNFHPLINSRTTTIASRDLIRFLEETGHPPLVTRISI
jgi:Ala-tRNA(Pro) deacylase